MVKLEYKIGDSREVLKTLPEKSINCCVTSPPYFGLRDYGHDDQIGLEETPEQYINELVQVFREVKRVLRDDGTLWLNIGDSYAGSCMKGGNNGINLQGGEDGFKIARQFDRKNDTPGCKPKDLIGIPWMLAFALRADGWYLRQDIIWHKPNPMPESVQDRCTKAHEYIFLLSKSQKYYFDNEAIQEKATTKPTIRDKQGKGYQADYPKGERFSKGERPWRTEKRNKRSVWSVNTKPFKEAHFAVFPPELITPCILAGCPENGIVLDPFGGSGTTMEVCRKNQRGCMLIELNKDYEPIIRKRAMFDIPDLNIWA